MWLFSFLKSGNLVYRMYFIKIRYVCVSVFVDTSISLKKKEARGSKGVVVVLSTTSLLTMRSAAATKYLAVCFAFPLGPCATSTMQLVVFCICLDTKTPTFNLWRKSLIATRKELDWRLIYLYLRKLHQKRSRQRGHVTVRFLITLRKIPRSL
jgi:hypothetical protein